MSFPNPSLLLHPNIPKPLHGIAPRTIKGEIWWNDQRKIAYATNNFKCWACDVHKSKAKYHNWLEAHEIYEIDYRIGRVDFKGVCALCHSCHNFIHSGRLYSLYSKGEIDGVRVSDILTHGFEILKAAGLKMNPFALGVAKEIDLNIFEKFYKLGVHKYGLCLCEWNDWHMTIDGKEYKGKFKTFNDWRKFYSK